jgi:serine/threonine protein kinase
VTIKRFRSKKELLNGLLGALKGEHWSLWMMIHLQLSSDHERCYKAGIIHRDVSVNNIVLSGGEGHLIDFDHCKITNRSTDYFTRLIAEPPPTDPKERWRTMWSAIFEKRILDIIAVTHSGEEHIPLGSLERRLHPKLFERSNLVSASDLGWDQVRETLLRSPPILMCYFQLYRIPSFEDRRAGPGYITVCDQTLFGS